MAGPPQPVRRRSPAHEYPHAHTDADADCDSGATHEHSHLDADTDANRDDGAANEHTNSYSDCYADRGTTYLHADANGDCDAGATDEHSHPDRYYDVHSGAAYQHADANGNRHPTVADQHPHPHADDSAADTKCDPFLHSDAYVDADVDRDPLCHGDVHADADVDRNTDAGAADQHANSHPDCHVESGAAHRHPDFDSDLGPTHPHPDPDADRNLESGAAHRHPDFDSDGGPTHPHPNSGRRHQCLRPAHPPGRRPSPERRRRPGYRPPPAPRPKHGHQGQPIRRPQPQRLCRRRTLRLPPRRRLPPLRRQLKPPQQPTPTPGAPATPTPSEQPTVITVPVGAHLEGGGGTLWRSDLYLTNREGLPVDVRISYQPCCGEPLVRTYTLGTYSTLLFEDVVKGMFAAGDGRGPLRIETLTGGVAVPAVVSRTFAETTFGNIGQGIPAVAHPRAGVFYLTGLRDDDDFRSNVAVTATTDGDVTAPSRSTAAATAVVHGSVQRSVAAGQQGQWSITELFPGASRPGVPMTVQVWLSSPGVTYASVVDNASSDAVTHIGAQTSRDWIVPAVARIPGVQGTFWYSDLAISNPGDSYAMVDFEYLPEGTDNSSGGMVSSTLLVPANTTWTIEDVVHEIFGVDDGKGVLRVRSTQHIVVASRVYTSGSNGGTMGHGLQAVSPDDLRPDARVLSGVRMRGGFRTNVGVVTGEVAALVRFRLRAEDGVQVGETYKEVPARSMRQWSLSTLFGGDLLRQPNPAGSLVVDADADVFSYLVVVDGSSQDPVLFVPEG